MLINHICSEKECLNENLTSFFARINKFFAKSFAQQSAKNYLQKLQSNANEEKTNDTRNLTGAHFEVIDDHLYMKPQHAYEAAELADNGLLTRFRKMQRELICFYVALATRIGNI